MICTRRRPVKRGAWSDADRAFRYRV